MSNKAREMTSDEEGVLMIHRGVKNVPTSAVITSRSHVNSLEIRVISVI